MYQEEVGDLVKEVNGRRGASDFDIIIRLKGVLLLT